MTSKTVSEIINICLTVAEPNFQSSKQEETLLLFEYSSFEHFQITSFSKIDIQTNQRFMFVVIILLISLRATQSN